MFHITQHQLQTIYFSIYVHEKVLFALLFTNVHTLTQSHAKFKKTKQRELILNSLAF